LRTDGTALFRSIKEPACTRIAIGFSRYIGRTLQIGIDVQYIFSLEGIYQNPAAYIGLQYHPGGFVIQFDAIFITEFGYCPGTWMLCAHRDGSDK
jgi:hypothetical protein